MVVRIRLRGWMKPMIQALGFANALPFIGEELYLLGWPRLNSHGWVVECVKEGESVFGWEPSEDRKVELPFGWLMVLDKGLWSFVRT